MEDEEFTGEVQETEEENGGPVKPSLLDLDKDVLVDYIKKLNRENAGHRTRNKELSEKASKFDEIERSKMSEVERLQEEKAALEKELRPHRLGKIQKDVAKSAGLHESYADLIKGETAEEMAEFAAILAERLPSPDGGSDDEEEAPKAKPSADDYFVGSAGKRPISDDTVGADWFNEVFG